MKFKRIALVVIGMTMIMGAAACSEKNETVTDSGSATVSESQVIEDEDDISKFEDKLHIDGEYIDRVSGRAVMNVEYSVGNYDVVITWANSASSAMEWSLIARDDENGNLTYGDCSCDNVEYDEQGNGTYVNVYENGKGSLVVNDDGTIGWTDDEGVEHIFEKMN